MVVATEEQNLDLTKQANSMLYSFVDDHVANIADQLVKWEYLPNSAKVESVNNSSVLLTFLCRMTELSNEGFKILYILCSCNVQVHDENLDIISANLFDSMHVLN